MIWCSEWRSLNSTTMMTLYITPNFCLQRRAGGYSVLSGRSLVSWDSAIWSVFWSWRWAGSINNSELAQMIRLQINCCVQIRLYSLKSTNKSRLTVLLTHSRRGECIFIQMTQLLSERCSYLQGQGLTLSTKVQINYTRLPAEQWMQAKQT